MPGLTRSVAASAVMLLLCLAAAACGPRPSFRPFDTYGPGESAVYGYVTDLYSCGLENAQVTLSGSADTSTTNTSGQYRLRVRSGERYTVVAQAPEFGVDSATLDVGSDPLRRDFSLAPLPCPEEECRPYRPPCRPEFLAR